MIMPISLSVWPQNSRFWQGAIRYIQCLRQTNMCLSSGRLLAQRSAETTKLVSLCKDDIASFIIGDKS